MQRRIRFRYETDALILVWQQVMAEMENEMSSMNEDNPDPRQLGRLMRKMTEATAKRCRKRWSR